MNTPTIPEAVVAEQEVAEVEVAEVASAGVIHVTSLPVPTHV